MRRGEGVFGPERGGVTFFDGGGAEKYKLRSLKEFDTLVTDSGAQETLQIAAGETRSTEGLGDLEDLWSRTVLTEVSEGVVVLEGLGLFLIKLELEQD